MKHISYIAVISKSGDSNYGAHFPDFPGCVTCEDDINRCIKSAAQVLTLHVKGTICDEIVLPCAKSLNAILQDNKDAEDYYTCVRITIPVIGI